MPVIRRNPWPDAALRAALFLGGSLLIGWWSGHPLLVFLLVAFAWAAWHVRQLYRLERWLRQERKLEPPRARGLWGEVFDGLHQLQQRQRIRRRQLRDMLRRYRESTRAMPDATVVLRGDYQIEWANAAATRLLGLHWPQDEGQRVGNICRHPEFAEFLAQRTRETRVAILPSPIAERRTLEVRLVPYGVDQYLLLARDITHVRRLERMRQDFVANVSHELRTPLTVIYGVAENLEPAVEPGGEAARSLELLQEQSERMRRLVDDLLTLSRLETGEAPDHVAWIRIEPVMRQLCEEAQALSGERLHQIEFQGEPDLELRGNEAELRSAFSNLIFNAVKYTPQGGQIRVRWKQERSGARFEVEDSGIGIPAQHISRLTERFYRVDDSRAKDTGGTGLGLAIVKHVLTRHGAHLAVESRYGVGSTFACHFPPHVVRSKVLD